MAKRKLLIHFDGNDGDTSLIATTGQVVTFHGTAQLDTSQKYSGSAALLLDGNSDYVTVPSSEDWNFGVGDFVVKTRIRLAALPGADTHFVIFSRNLDGNNNWWLSLYGGVGGENPIYPHIFGYFGGVNMNHSTTIPALAAGTLYHIAFVRTGDTMYFFLDGVRYSFSSAMTEDIVSLNAPLTIGAEGTTPAGRFFNGWIDEVEIKKGTSYLEPIWRKDTKSLNNWEKKYA